MKIIYIHQYFNTPTMKGGVRSYDIALHLASLGHEVHMITSWRDQSKAKDWFCSNENGINVHWYPIEYSNHLSYRSRISVFLKFAWNAYSYSKKLNMDIIFATSTPLTVAIPAILISRKKSIPMVFEVRDLWPDVAIAVGALTNPITKFIAKKLEKMAYRKSEAIIALSDGMKQGIKKAGYPDERIAVITNFSNNSLFNVRSSHVSSSFRKSREWLNSKPLLVYTGAFGLINGLTYLIDLAEQLQLIGSDVKILLVGDGRDYERLIEYAKDKGVLDQNLFIESQIQKSELPSLLSAADLACNIVIENSAVWDNSANKFFDALASGTPVLVNDQGWQAKLIQQTLSGIASFGIPMNELAFLIHKQLHDEEWKFLAGKNAKYLAQEYFDKNKLVDMVENIINESSKYRGFNASKIGINKLNDLDKNETIF